MRIIYIHQYYRTPAENGGTRSYETARRLVADGHTVSVITSDTRPGAACWRTQSNGLLTVHHAPIAYDNAMGARARIAAFGAFTRAAGQRAAQLKDADVVLATSSPLTVAIPGRRASRRHGAPMVFEVRDVWPETPIALGQIPPGPPRWAAQHLERWAYRRAAHIVALSPDMAASIRQRTDTPVTVVPNACDTDLFAGRDGKYLRESTPWLGDRPMLLYAGTFGMVNNVRYLVDLAYELSSDLAAPGARIVLIGTGREHDTVREHAEKLGILGDPTDPYIRPGRNLFMLPPMPKLQVADWFAAADLVCSTTMAVPELWANSANKVFDGWAAGRPVAVNHGGWIADIIRDTGAGIVWGHNARPEAAAAATRAFLADSGRVTAARQAAHALAHGRYSRDACYQQLHQVLTDAATR